MSEKSTAPNAGKQTNAKKPPATVPFPTGSQPATKHPPIHAPFEIAGAFDSDGSLTILAADIGPGETKLRKFQMLAYTGGKLHIPGMEYPIAVDLNGLQANPRRPVVWNHDSNILLGHSNTVTISDNKLWAAGVFSGTHEKVGEVTTLADRDFPWQASIKAQAIEVGFLQPGQSMELNGQELSGPCYIAHKAILRELTIAAVGIDDDTKLAVAASASQTNQDQTMKTGTISGAVPGTQAAAGSTIQASANPATGATNTNGTGEQVPGVIQASLTGAGNNTSVDPIAEQNKRAAANATRLANISTICASFGHPKFTPEGATAPVLLESHAIEAGWTPEIVRAIASRNDRPGGPAIHSATNEQPTELVIEAALCKHGRLNDLEKQFDARTLETVDRHRELKRGVGLQQVLIMAAYIGGYAARAGRLMAGDIPEMIRAAYSTNALQSILSNATNKFIRQGFGQVERKWAMISAIGETNDFKQMESYRLIDSGEFEVIPATGKIPAGKVSDAKYTNQAEQYGKYIHIDRKAIVNDDIGIITRGPEQLARGAHKSLNRLFWAEFLKDKATFYTVARGNYKAGADTDLNIDGLSIAAALLKTMKDDGQEPAPMDTEGAFLVCNATDGPVADGLYVSENIVSGAGGKTTAANVHRNKYKPVSTGFLTDPDEWFLLANPNDVPVIEVVFLNGQQEPTIQEALPDTTYTGLILSGSFDFGINKQEFRGGVRLKGKA